MIIEITRDNHDTIKNPVFAEYAAIYLQIYDDFMDQVRASGIAIDENDYQDETRARLEALRQKGATIRNGGRSIFVNAISPACVACQTGVESETFFISLKCHRDCYFCFNPNQVDYEYHSQHQRDLVQELDSLHAAGVALKHLAVTGGEPLLFPDELVQFYAHAGETYPGVHKRLYTCGDHVNADILQELQAAGLEEVRFSIRVHDLEKGHRHTLDHIALARQYIPDVMVEMPVLPGTSALMQDLLLELNDLQITSINLLEFCYPLSGASRYNEKGFKVKQRPYRIPYNYWYAGGLPISESELLCLDLLDFVIERELGIGVHYCSLENKFTAQIYEQNIDKPVPGIMQFSPTDYFFKSAKVFGEDVPPVRQLFDRKGYDGYSYHQQHQYLEFHVDRIRMLRKLDVEVGIAISVIETRDGESYLRELKVDLTHPDKFKRHKDI